MSIPTVELHQAIVTVWANAGIDSLFKTFWTADDQTRFLTLNDGMAAPGTPMPYCVFTQQAASTIERMSGLVTTKSSKNMLRGISVSFEIFAAKKKNDSRSAKQLAAELAEAVMWKFGGHPTKPPAVMGLTTASLVNWRYANDYGLYVGEQEHRWLIDYECTIDVPYLAG